MLFPDTDFPPSSSSEQFSADVLTVAKEARRHTLGVFHPTFSLQRTVRSLLEKLPADAHLRASGKLCVSLTRLPDWKNVLVSQFESREDLIQVEERNQNVYPPWTPHTVAISHVWFWIYLSYLCRC